MIAAAYGYASDGNSSPEMEMLHRIDRFGVHAVMGRPVLYEREIRAMTAANNVVAAYRDRAKATSWEAWLKENPELGDLLFRAQRLYDGTS